LVKTLVGPLKPYDELEAQIVKEAHERYRFGARMLEPAIRKKYKIRISHNRINMYLKAQGLAQENQKSRNVASGFVTSESIAYRQGISTGMRWTELISRSASSLMTRLGWSWQVESSQ